MGAFFLSMFGIGKAVLTAVLTWLSKRSLAEIGCILLGIACLILFVAHRSEQRHAAKLETRLSKCSEGRKADRDAYAKAQSDAAAKNKAQVDSTIAKQEKINHETVSTLNARLELIRSELRKTASQRPAGGAQASPASPGPCTVTNPAWLCLAPADRLRAAENEERHDELIDWVEQQMKVDPNKP